MIDGNEGAGWELTTTQQSVGVGWAGSSVLGYIESFDVVSTWSSKNLERGGLTSLEGGESLETGWVGGSICIGGNGIPGD